VKIQVEFNPARVSEYRLIGYETRLLNREDFNNDKVDAGEVGAGAAVTALYEITPAGAPGAVDPLRYQPERPAAARRDVELAYLRIRYKLPGQPSSRLIERPIGDGDRARSLAEAPEATRFALAVAGFGQRLRGDPWMKGGFGWGDIVRTADRSRGYDPDGRRAQFVRLAERAGSAGSVSD
jgi:Ca-activated chloride channel family protein